jgi:Firmicute plasmid replication protein (RepL)
MSLVEDQSQNTNQFAEKMAELDQKARQQELADKDKLEELQRKNYNFVQYNKKSLMVLAKITAKSGLAGAIYQFMTAQMKQDNKLLVSREALAEFFEVSKTGVSNAIKLLVDNKFLIVVKSGNANIYCLNADVVWSQSRDKKEFAEFSCQVFLSKTEQEKVKQVKTENVKAVSLRAKNE